MTMYILGNRVAQGGFRHPQTLLMFPIVLGPAKGMALVEHLPDVEAVIVSKDNEVLVSSGLRGRVALTHPPTP